MIETFSLKERALAAVKLEEQTAATRETERLHLNAVRTTEMLIGQWSTLGVIVCQHEIKLDSRAHQYFLCDGYRMGYGPTIFDDRGDTWRGFDSLTHLGCLIADIDTWRAKHRDWVATASDSERAKHRAEGDCSACAFAASGGAS